MNHCLVLRLAMLVPCIAFSGAKADEPKKESPDVQAKDGLSAELEKLRGTWVVKSTIFDGKSIRDNYRFIFSKNTITKEWEQGRFDFNGPPRLDYDFELDLKADPKVIIEMIPATKKDDWRTRRLIYRFRGEQLEICFMAIRDGRGKTPTKFDGAAGTGQKLITLERVKEDKQKPKPKEP
jgi:uncharacterized protein (TIGR03067 family)